MIYGKFIDSSLEYERYNDTPEPEREFVFWNEPVSQTAYARFLKSEGGFRSSQLQGKIKAQTAEEGTAYAEAVAKAYDISPA